MTTPVRTAFDPYVILRELAVARVSFVLIGALARVIQGSDETAQGLDLTPSARPENLTRLGEALERMGVESSSAKSLAPSDTEGPVTLTSHAGEVKVVLAPAGTRGYADLRRKAAPHPLGEGLRPQVAAPGDLVRMLEAVGRPDQARIIETMRRVVELDRGLELER